MWEFLVSLTPHELDVLRTVSIVIGTGCVPVFGFVLTRFARIINRNAKQTVEQTATHQWVDGVQKPVSVAELTHRVVHTTEEFKGELTNLANDPLTGRLGSYATPIHGRRRLPTTDIPTQESMYE